MRINKAHTIEQIKAIYNDAKPKFVALQNPSGGYEVHFNTAKTPTIERFNEIIARLKQKSLTPGLYTFVTRAGTMSHSAIYEYPVGVGNYNLQEGTITIQPSEKMNNESGISNTKYLEIMTNVNKLELLLEFEKQNNKLLQDKIDELEKEVKELEANSNGNSWAKDLSETAKPLLDIFFEQRDRELTLKEQEFGRAKGLSSSRKMEKRIDNGVHPLQPGYGNYFDDIFNGGNDDDLNYECDYLEANFPEIYKQVVTHYHIEEIDDNEPEQNQATG